MDWVRGLGTRGAVLALLLSLMLPGLAAGQVEVQVTVMPAQLNVRESPGFDAVTLGAYARGDVLRITGWDGTVWVFAIPLAGDLTGWVHWDYVDFPNGFDVSTLPMITAAGAAAKPAAQPNDPAPSPSGIVHESVIPVVSAHAREIFVRGQAIGNRPDVFVTVGDSITAAPLFLDPIGTGFYELGDYASLQAAINYFSQTPARTGNSFVNEHIAAHGGWTTHNLVTPGLHLRSDICNDDETVLMCEYRLTRPSIALIMIGTNDVAAGMETIHFRHSMEMIVQLSLHYGVIPVLSTMPDNLSGAVNNNRVYEFNNVIRDVAAIYDVPLLDYWRALQAIPNKGLSNDGVHPSYDGSDPYSTAKFTGEYLYYGYNLRNLTALLTLDVIWRGAMD